MSVLLGVHYASPRLSKTRRHLPHWTLTGSTYFVTFHTVSGALSADERRIVLEHVKSGKGRFYDLAAVTVMPDHAHLLLKPIAGFDLSRIMKGIKGARHRLVNRHRNGQGNVWQDESWDRIVRDIDEFQEKLEYMYNNPVKEGLVADGDAYDGWYFNPDFT